MSFSNRRNTILTRFFLSYILILTLPLALSMVIYAKTVEMVEEDIKESSLALLEQSRDIIDKHLQEAEAMAVRAALDPKVASLANMDGIGEGSADIDKLISAVNNLSAYRITDGFIKEFFIYFRTSDIILTNSTANTKMRLLYGNYFKFGDMSYEDWASEIAGQVQFNKYIPSTEVLFNGRAHPVITKLQSIPIEHPKSNRGCVMVFIDTNAVNQLLRKINPGTDGYTYILNSDNTMISSVHPGEREAGVLEVNFEGQSGVMNSRVSGEDMVVSYTVSPVNGWKYVAAVPSEFVMKKVNYIRAIILSSALALLLSGFILSCFLSYRNAKPLKEIADSLRAILKDSGKYRSEYTFLSGGISALIESNRDLGEKLDEQLPLIRAVFLKRLLKGSFRDMREIAANLSHLGIRLEGSRYVAVILKISGYRDLINGNILKELDISRLVANREIEGKWGGGIASCDLDENKIALLLSFGAGEEEEIRARVEAMAEELFHKLLDRYQIYVSFASGSVCSSLADIGYSFSEAKQALDYIAGEQEKRLVWYFQVPKQGDRYIYTIETEKRLVHYTGTGEEDELRRLLGNIRTENFVRRRLSATMLRLLVHHMTGTLTRLYQQTGIECPEGTLIEIFRAEEAEYAYALICKCFCEHCASVNLKKRDSDELLKDRVLEYVNEAYMREDLTLYGVAAHFSLTETYLYHFFREKTGTSFASFLEGLRMERAYSLLTETRYSISDISAKVGYSSVHSFRRAFKRRKGYIPSELRNA